MTSTPSKATAGPWRLQILGPQEADLIHKGTFMGLNGGSGAPGKYDAGDAEEWEANARLIAAAPDLLAELRDVLEWALVEKAPLRDQEIKSIRAAISRATGEA